MPTKTQHIVALRETALLAVAHVAMANYREREAEANQAIWMSAKSGKVIDPNDLKK